MRTAVSEICVRAVHIVARHAYVALAEKQDSAIGGVACGDGLEVVGSDLRELVADKGEGAVTVDLDFLRIGKAHSTELVIRELIYGFLVGAYLDPVPACKTG